VSLWYPGAQRARAIAAFMAAIPVTGVVGGPLSGALLGLNGLCGLRGWQWLFLLEGLPAVILGGVTLIYLTDRPENAQWLTAAERDWVVATLAAERDACKLAPSVSPMVALTNGTIWQLGIIFLLTAIGFYGYSFWSPLLIRSLLGISDLGVGLVSAAISLVTICGMLINSAHSDRTNEQPMHVVIPLLIMGVGCAGCAFFNQPLLAVISLALIPIGHCGAYGPFWSIPTRFLTGAAAASGVALVATIASVGGFLGPTIIGSLKDLTGTHVLAFILLGGFAFIAAILALRLRQAEVLKKSGASL
jgi:ACS family tartrate transporter-like MFS transporter